MEQASAWHCCIVSSGCHLRPWWEFRIPVQNAASKKPETTGHDGNEKRKPTNRQFRTTKNHDQTTVEGKTVDVSTFLWTKEP